MNISVSGMTTPWLLLLPLFGGLVLVPAAFDVFGNGLNISLIAAYQLFVVAIFLVSIVFLIKTKNIKWYYSSLVFSALSVILVPILAGGLSSI
jgi:hypothetical protein